MFLKHSSQLSESIGDFDNYDESLKRIVASIFGTPIKPPLGEPPEFVTKSSTDFARNWIA